MTKPKVVVVDDEEVSRKVHGSFLEDAGYDVIFCSDAESVLSVVDAEDPQCVVIDIMMPKVDGLEVVRRLRAQTSKKLRIVVATSKNYLSDKRRAFELGCDAYLVKPLRSKELISAVCKKPKEVEFWGVRGTLPCSGADTIKYGGNTSCVSVKLENGKRFIFDAGSGIKSLSDHLMSADGEGHSHVIFFSHAHWDHINALPFFAPLYSPLHTVDLYGPRSQDLSVRDLMSAQMDSVYFPVAVQDLSAKLSFHDLYQDDYVVDGYKIKTMLLNHPGACLGYRLEIEGFTFCYVTDNEIFHVNHPLHSEGYFENLAKFVSGASVLVTDTTYFDEEYETKFEWGHSCLSRVLDLVQHSDVKNLCLFHHDPAHRDQDIDRKLVCAQEGLAQRESSTNVFAPSQDTTIEFSETDLVFRDRKDRDKGDKAA